MVILHSTLPRSQSARRPDPSGRAPSGPAPSGRATSGRATSGRATSGRAPSAPATGGPAPEVPAPDGSTPQLGAPAVTAAATFTPPTLRLVGGTSVGPSDDRPSRPRRGGDRTRRAARGRQVLRDAGMATAEYAIATLAAVGFAGLLLVVLRSGEVRSLLMGLIKRALSVSA